MILLRRWRIALIVGKASQSRRRTKKRSALAEASALSQPSRLSIQAYLRGGRFTPEWAMRFQGLIPRDLAASLFRFIDCDRFSPREDVDLLFGDLPYDLRLTMSYRPARVFMASALGSDPDPRDFLRLAYLIWFATTCLPEQ